MSEVNGNWRIFQGNHTPHNGIQSLPPAPPWRRFRGQSEAPAQVQAAESYWQQVQKTPPTERDLERGQTFRLRDAQSQIVDAVNAALYLRRPLLVTGKPGSGKTSLAYAIAYELNLGAVLMWSITARTTLQDGLYRYDAIARLQDTQLKKEAQGQSQREVGDFDPYQNIGQYLRLGALGTAFLPSPYPRVLLIDEIDKSDINLPNDLLNLLEEGEFEIPELVRLAKRNHQPVEVRTADDLEFPLKGGKVRCQSFPLIVMTSNGERDFPPAFLRRCLQVRIPKPTPEDLRRIVEAHLGEAIAAQFVELIEEFARKSNTEAATFATDQLLNVVYLCTHNANVADLKPLLFAALTSLDSNG